MIVSSPKSTSFTLVPTCPPLSFDIRRKRAYEEARLFLFFSAPAFS
jgi:hypothetical protein